MYNGKRYSLVVNVLYFMDLKLFIYDAKAFFFVHVSLLSSGLEIREYGCREPLR
jgi:hypothetical protein